MKQIAGDPPYLAQHYAANTRHRQHDAGRKIISLEDGRAQFAFDAPQWAVTPGQSVVVYEGEVCLGGGIIA